jgi:hypothetical protein
MCVRDGAVKAFDAQKRLFSRCRSCRQVCDWTFSPCTRVQRYSNFRIQGRAKVVIDIRNNKAYMHIAPIAKFVLKSEVVAPSTVIVESEQQIPENKCTVCTFRKYCDLKEYTGFKGCKNFDYEESVKVEVVSYKKRVKVEVETAEVSKEVVERVKQLMKNVAKMCINCNDEECKKLPLHIETTASGTRFYKFSPHVRCPYPDVSEFDAVRYWEIRLENLFRVPERVPDHFSDQAVAFTDENGVFTDVRQLKNSR